MTAVASPSWAVLQTHPNAEARVVENLVRQGIDHYWPRIRDGARVRSLFPRYLFAEYLKPLRSTFGVAQVLASASPLKLVIQGLQKQEDKKGFIVLDHHLKPISRFNLNQPVKSVEAGMLSHQVGLFKGMKDSERCEVLYRILGRDVIRTLTERHLIAVQSVAA